MRTSGEGDLKIPKFCACTWKPNKTICLNDARELSHPGTGLSALLGHLVSDILLFGSFANLVPLGFRQDRLRLPLGLLLLGARLSLI